MSHIYRVGVVIVITMTQFGLYSKLTLYGIMGLNYLGYFVEY